MPSAGTVNFMGALLYQYYVNPYCYASAVIYDGDKNLVAISDNKTVPYINAWTETYFTFDDAGCIYLDEGGYSLCAWSNYKVYVREDDESGFTVCSDAQT